MPKYYIGVKIVTAWQEKKDGKPGYVVRYEDGYQSWSPKGAFEKAYLGMDNDGSRVTESMVEDFIGDVEAKRIDRKTVLAIAETKSGFTQYETASCVDPANFDMEVGKSICVDRMKSTLWECLGFVVQWGRFGLSSKK